jgi:aldose 1-epimerase
VNLTTHSYYNLDGSDDVRDHRLLVSADVWTPVDDELIPTGAIAAVAGTRFDFREARPIRFESYNNYDNNFVLRRDTSEEGLAHCRDAVVRPERPRDGAVDERARAPGL